MFYEYTLTVPANTAKASPATAVVPVNPGTVTRVEIQFPGGCNGMVFAAVRRSTHQVWPLNTDDGIAGENANIWWSEDFDLTDAPFEFTVVGWSPGTTYDHDITFRFALLALATAQAQRETPGLLARISKIVTGR